MRRILAAGAAAAVALAGCSLLPTDQLYTHCGVYELTHDDKWYVRDGGPLTEGGARPPAGWDDPYQSGHITVTGTTATFTDDQGHHETFTERPGATSPLQVCS